MISLSIVMFTEDTFGRMKIDTPVFATKKTILYRKRKYKLEPQHVVNLQNTIVESYFCVCLTSASRKTTSN